jgi:2-dehydropantoate 2-reductase
MADPILVWGAGAIGGTAGAYLVRAGHAVHFVDLVPDHVAAIRDPARGLTIEGPVAQFTVTAPAFTPDELRGRYSRIFLAVKAQHTEAACRALLPHLAEDGYVLSLQNGLCETLIAPIIGAPRTMGAFINYGADWHAPGRIVYGNRGPVVVGEIDGAETPRLAALHALLRDFEPDAVKTREIWGYLWGKLGYLTLLYAQALGEKGIADCLDRAELVPLFRAMVGEVMRVALAEGVRPQPFAPFDPAGFLPGATEAEARAALREMVDFNRPSAKTHSGIWRDLWVRRRLTETDAQIAPISTIGVKHGIACPLVDRLVAMIHECEAGTRPMDDANLVELARV